MDTLIEDTSEESSVTSPTVRKGGRKKEQVGEAPVEYGCQTLMVRNLPTPGTKDQFIDMLNRTGFQGRYDIVYVPLTIGKSKGRRWRNGYGFVNMTDPAAAAQLAAMWHGQELFDKASYSSAIAATTLCVSAAETQGREACLALWAEKGKPQGRQKTGRPTLFENGHISILTPPSAILLPPFEC